MKAPQVDVLQLGSSLALRHFGRCGSAIAILDLLHLGSTFAVRSFARVGSALSVLDFVHTGSSLSLRGPPTSRKPLPGAQTFQVSR